MATVQAQATFARGLQRAEKGDLAILFHLLKTDLALQYQIKNFVVGLGKWPKRVSNKKGLKVVAKYDSPLQKRGCKDTWWGW